LHRPRDEGQLAALPGRSETRAGTAGAADPRGTKDGIMQITNIKALYIAELQG
jgi:hypothetical protein